MTRRVSSGIGDGDLDLGEFCCRDENISTIFKIMLTINPIASAVDSQDIFRGAQYSYIHCVIYGLIVYFLKRPTAK